MIPINLELLGFPISQSEAAICGRLCLSAAFFLSGRAKHGQNFGEKSASLLILNRDHFWNRSLSMSWPPLVSACGACVVSCRSTRRPRLDARFFFSSERRKFFFLSFLSLRVLSSERGRDRGWRRRKARSEGNASMFGCGVWNVSVRTLDRFVYFQRQSRFSDSMIGPPRLIAIVGSLNFPLL